jgi:hypothetical protein
VAGLADDWDAAVLDLDHLPEPYRQAWLDRAATDGRPTLVHSYNLTAAQARQLRQAGVAIVRRLTARRFARWLRAARPVCGA